MHPLNKKITPFQIFRILWVIILVFVTAWSMRLSPIWTGSIRQHRNQYEVMTESLLNGHLYMDIEVDEKLMEMENPYDPDLRHELGVNFKFDHAYYKGHYYMYFGVVPVFLLFLPFRLLFGRALSAYHATQIFTALIIIGFFFLIDFLRKRFFPKMGNFISTVMASAFSLASVWYFADAPALYCTAISAAVCMMVWSFYFYFRAVFDSFQFNKRIVFAVFGAFFGALAFGCRPPVALANITVIPMFILFLRTNNVKKENFLKVSLIFLPYIVIGALLMAYNYLRFENPFEFGQIYQLTNYDQHAYNMKDGMALFWQLNGFVKMFIANADLKNEFPYVQHAGIFFEYPIFIISLGALFFSARVRSWLKQNHLLPIIIFSWAAVFIMTIFEIAMTPHVEERYHFDMLYLISLTSFLVLGSFYYIFEAKSIKNLNIFFFFLSVFVIITSVLLFFVPHDSNLTAYYPEVLEMIREKTWMIK